MKFEKLKPGMVVFDVQRRKMGNTTLTETVVFRVLIKEVDIEKRAVQASWNSNPPKTFYERSASKWREKEPVLIKRGLVSRLATREELKEKKAAEGKA